MGIQSYLVSVNFEGFKMENNINAMILLSYAIPKNYKKKYSRRFKVILPRKKTSSKRIGINHHWNLLEEASQRKRCHFSCMNFNNEINDNVVNEIRERALKSRTSYNYKSQRDMPPMFTGSAYNLLTPPLTPQIGHGIFKFGSDQSSLIQNLESEEQGIPLTPSESDVFAY